MKLFVAEQGSEVMTSLAEGTDDRLKVVSALAFIEVRSAIRRRQRSKDLSRLSAERAILALFEEAERVMEESVSNRVLVEASRLIDRRSVRTLDAIQLATAIVARERNAPQPLTFVCSDARLLEAAEAESFTILNPETV